MSDIDRAFAPGRMVVGRYLIEKRIARGGMADVFAGLDRVLHRRVAIKAFRFDTPAGHEGQRIQREIRMLASLRHAGLVTVFDAGDAPSDGGGESPFFVMELVDGPTLAELRGQRALTPAEVAQFGVEVAEALAYVHSCGIVHRDIKPANILLDPKPRGGGYTAKLTDFGIARLVDSTRLTRDGVAVGTANYVSPEQTTGDKIGPPSDVYSLGLVLIEALTGEVVYPGSGVEAVVARLHRDPVDPERLPAQWMPLLTAMTDRNPAARPRSEEVAAQLRGLMTSTPMPTRTKVFGVAPSATQMIQTPPPPPPRFRNRRDD